MPVSGADVRWAKRGTNRWLWYAVAAACVLGALGIAAAGYQFYLRQQATVHTQAREALATIADLKVRQLVEWRSERIADARIIAAAEALPVVRQVLAGKAGEAARERTLLWLEAIRHAQGYANVILVNRSGRVCLGVGRFEGKATHYADLADRVVREGSIVVSDLHYDEGLHGPHLGLSVPLRAAPSAAPEGVLLLGIDPNEFLFPLIRSWPTPSRTAETLLARKEGDSVLFLNNVRHREGTALRLRIPLSNTELPAVWAALNQEDVRWGTDYRGHRVLAATRRVPDSPWVLVAKEDEEEIEAPARQQALWLAFIGCSLAVVILAAAALVWRTVRLRFLEERYNAELERRAIIGHYDYLSRFANDIILLMSADGRIVEANDRAVSAYGYERRELVGMPLVELRAEETRKGFYEQWRKAEAADSVLFETVHRREDGTTFPVEVSSRRIAIEGKVLIQSIIRDITERRHGEEERARLQEQLVQAQKMESIGRLAGGVAHDFNNLLTVINGYANLGVRELPPGHPMQEVLAEIEHAGERAAGLTRQLLAFSRRQVTEPVVLDMNELVADVSNMLGRLVGEHIEVITRPAPGPAPVYADPVQMQQVLMNLAANSRDAMPNGGKFVIEVGSADLNEYDAAALAGAKPGPYVLLTVTDTGMGMDEPTRRSAFDPFFTTKPQGQGTGLGLATVYGIVRQSEGWIWLYSEPGQGTTVKIYLPRRSEEGKPATATAAEDPASLRGTEVILVVEDQAEVRQLAARALRQYGYKVIEAATGAEAVQLDVRPDLLITDLVMPGMSGRELAERMSVVDPNVKILFISGYASDVITGGDIGGPRFAYLPKPFTPAALAAKVRAILGPQPKDNSGS